MNGPKKFNFETQPVSRIVRNIISVFEFKLNEEESLPYEKYIKHQLEVTAKAQRYCCVLCDAGNLVDKRNRKKPQWLRDDLEKHLADECPKFEIQCECCNFRYAREVFNDPEVHSCTKNLNQTLDETREKLADTEKSLGASNE